MSKKRILLTGGRSPITLDLARQLSYSGHTVFVAESTPWHITRFSNSVKNSFVVPSPRFDLKGFIDKLVSIVEEEAIDFLLPVFEEVLYVSRGLARFPESCTVFASPFEVLHELHNKWSYVQLVKKLGINAPETTLIRSLEELHAFPLTKPHALKAAYSRASQSVFKLAAGKALPTPTIDAHNPWILQEWLEGERFCSYSIACQGKLKAHGSYPVRFTVDGNSCITFEPVYHQGIEDWVERFVSLTNYTGQISFDFFDVPERGLLTIECNPRATSGVHLFRGRDRLDMAFFDKNSSLIRPQPNSKKQIATGMLMYGWREFNKAPHLGSFLGTLARTKDVVFELKDPVPLFSQLFLFPRFVVQSYSLKKSIPAVFTHDIDWNGEPLLEIL